MHKPYYSLALCVVIIALSGCGNDQVPSDESEKNDPLVKAALSYRDNGQWDQAEKAFKDALVNEPLMASPHLELALIYQQQKPDFARAIYHFERYLELRPNAEKADLIEEQILNTKQAFAVNTINQNPELLEHVPALNELSQENALLKRRLAEASQVRQTTTQTPTPTTTPPERTTTATTSEPATTSYQTYTVVSGDTLNKIAIKFYGDATKWDVIYDANRESMTSPNSLNVGQTLVIPKLGN